MDNFCIYKILAWSTWLAGKKIVPELIQYQASSDKIAATAEELLQNPQKMEAMCGELKKIKDKLGEPGSRGGHGDA